MLLLGACIVPTVPLRAQMQGEAGPPPREFDLNVGIGGGYTSNPGLRSDNGELSGDSIGDLHADLVNRKRSPRTDWSARYGSFYSHYGSNNQFDSINHALDFNGRYLVTRSTHLNLFEHFFYSRNPLQTGVTGPTDDTVILTRQANRWRSVSDAAFDTSVSRSVTLQVGASARVERLDLSPSIDSNTYSGRFGIQKQLGQQDSISSTFSYSRFDFNSESVANAEAQGVDVSWSHGPAASAVLVLTAGMSRVAREGQSQDWLMAGATFHHPFRRADFISGYRRSLDADAGVGTVTVAQNAYAGISRTVGTSSSLGVFGEYGTRDSVLEAGDRLALTYTGGSLRGSISLGPRFNISAEARRRKQTAAEGAGEDLTVDSIFLGLDFRVF